MTWNYSGDPSESGKDELRFLVGDTDPDDQQITDEELNYVLTIHPQRTGYANYLGAALAARQIAARYTKAIDKSVGSLRLSLSSRKSDFLALAKALEEKDASGTTQVVGAPILGGGGKKYLDGPEWFDEYPS